MTQEAREIFNIVLIHVARTWERIRVEQPHEEMPQDNIGSTDSIEQIATTIFDGKIIQDFINGDKDDYWLDNTEEGMSDIYIENAAHNIIHKHYLGSKAYNELYKVVHTDDTLNPNEIVKVGRVEFVVDGENFDTIENAYGYWVSFDVENRYDLEVFSRVWVTLNMNGVERRELEDGCNQIECNVVKLDFKNNSRNRNSIEFELWEWVKDMASPKVNKLPFEIKWEDVNGHLHLMGIEHTKYNLTFDEILNDIVTIDQMELKGRGFIEFDENVAKQNVEVILDLMERYRGVTLV